MAAATPFDSDRFHEVYTVLTEAKRNPVRGQNLATQVQDVVKDYELVSAMWRITAMAQAIKDGVLSDWIILREGEDDDIHGAVFDVCGAFPLECGEWFPPEELRAAVHACLHSEYGMDA